MRQKRRGDDICTKSRVDNLSDGKKVWGGRKGRPETKEVLNETLGKVSGGREMDERKKVSAVQRCCERCGGAREIAP